MTLRDLTPRQAYNLRRKCDKERKKHAKLYDVQIDWTIWDRAFSHGVKAALALNEKPALSPSDEYHSHANEGY